MRVWGDVGRFVPGRRVQRRWNHVAALYPDFQLAAVIRSRSPSTVFESWTDAGETLLFKNAPQWVLHRHRNAVGDVRNEYAVVSEMKNIAAELFPGRAEYTEHGSYAVFARSFVAGKTLDDVPPIFSKKEAIDITVLMAAAYEPAERLGICVRDIKSDNMVLGSDEKGQQTVFTIDFDTAIPLDSIPEETPVTAGTPCYMLLRAIQGKKEATRDAYALGVACYQILLGKLPFGLRGNTPMEAYEILKWLPRPSFPDDFDTELADVLTDLLRHDERPTITETLSRARAIQEARSTANSLEIAMNQGELTSRAA